MRRAWVRRLERCVIVGPSRAVRVISQSLFGCGGVLFGARLRRGRKTGSRLIHRRNGGSPRRGAFGVRGGPPRKTRFRLETPEWCVVRGGVLCGQGWGASEKDCTWELAGMPEVGRRSGRPGAGRWVGRTRLDGLTTNGTRLATSGIGLTRTEIRRSASGMGLNRKRSRVMRPGNRISERGGSRAGVGSMGREGCRDIRPSVHELYPNGNCSAHEPQARSVVTRSRDSSRKFAASSAVVNPSRRANLLRPIRATGGW